MKCFTYVFLFFCLVRSSTLGIAQVAPAANPTVAYIYVSHSLSDSNSEVIGFAVDATGALSRIAGSPFPANVQQMALNGKYLFGDQNGIDIVSFQIAATGQLRQVASFDDSSHGSPQALFLDHTGATLYAEDFNAEGTGNNGYQFFRINGTTGQLSLLGLSTANTENGIPMVFSANNQFAYSANCVHGDSTVFGFSRNADGSLTRLNIVPEPVFCAAWPSAACRVLHRCGRKSHHQQHSRQHAANRRHRGHQSPHGSIRPAARRGRNHRPGGVSHEWSQPDYALHGTINQCARGPDVLGQRGPSLRHQPVRESTVCVYHHTDKFCPRT